MATAMEQDLADRIEKLLDDYGAANFFSILGFVCGEKSDHCATTWQDPRRAKIWLQISKDLDRLTAMAEEWTL